MDTHYQGVILLMPALLWVENTPKTSSWECGRAHCTAAGQWIGVGVHRCTASLYQKEAEHPQV